ncbi:MAG: endonuclease/exonuclease/phosphatase family protein [Actinomycetota bacterium]
MSPRPLIAIALAGGLLVGSAAVAGESCAPERSLGTAGPGLVIVTANLNEAYDARDVRSPKELKSFPRRVASRTPNDPDVLLLQEVRERSAKYVARAMSRQTGDRYLVATPVLEEAYRATATKWIERDTAVLLNSETMKPLSKGAVVRTPKPWGVKKKRMYKEHGYVLAKERSSGARVAALSLHFPPAPGGRSTFPGKFAEWTRKVAGVLKRRYPNATRIVGGDFNQVSGGAHRPVLENFGYTFIVPAGVILGVDHIFTTGVAGRAGADSREGSYSDHRFFWGESLVP